MSNYTNLQTTFRISCGPHAITADDVAEAHDVTSFALKPTPAVLQPQQYDVILFGMPQNARLCYRRPKPIEMTALPLFLCWLLTAAGLIFLISE